MTKDRAWMLRVRWFATSLILAGIGFTLIVAGFDREWAWYVLMACMWCMSKTMYWRGYLRCVEQRIIKED